MNIGTSAISEITYAVQRYTYLDIENGNKLIFRSIFTAFLNYIQGVSKHPLNFKF